MVNRNSAEFRRKKKILLNAAAAVSVTGAAVLTAGIILNVKFPRYYDASVVLLTAGAVITITFAPLAWIFYYMFTRQTMEEKLEALNNPSVECFPAAKVPRMRFNFKESAVREAFGKIAEKYKFDIDIYVQNFEILPFGSDCSPKKGYDIFLRRGKYDRYFHIYIRQECIEFYAYRTCDEMFLFFDDIARTNFIEIFDETKSFVSELVFDELSDDEIFGVIEKMIYVFYNTERLEVLKSPSGLYRKYYTAQDYVFYLDAPDYYGFTETTVIGNFKFILNGGTENG